MRVGIDSVEIERIETSLKTIGFKERVFSAEEIGFLKRTESYAANFAAKEAFSKAIGTGMRGMRWSDISVMRDDLGAPYLVLTGGAAISAKGLDFTVSLTHTKTTATAIVIAYEDK